MVNGAHKSPLPHLRTASGVQWHPFFDDFWPYFSKSHNFSTKRSLNIPKIDLKSSHHILSRKNIFLQVQVEVAHWSWSSTSTSTSTSTIFHFCSEGLNSRKTVSIRCSIFFLGYLWRCFIMMSRWEKLIGHGVDGWEHQKIGCPGVQWRPLWKKHQKNIKNRGGKHEKTKL